MLWILRLCFLIHKILFHIASLQLPENKKVPLHKSKNPAARAGFLIFVQSLLLVFYFCYHFSVGIKSKMFVLVAFFKFKLIACGIVLPNFFNIINTITSVASFYCVTNWLRKLSFCNILFFLYNRSGGVVPYFVIYAVHIKIYLVVFHFLFPFHIGGICIFFFKSIFYGSGNICLINILCHGNTCYKEQCG